MKVRTADSYFRRSFISRMPEIFQHIAVNPLQTLNEKIVISLDWNDEKHLHRLHAKVCDLADVLCVLRWFLFSASIMIGQADNFYHQRQKFSHIPFDQRSFVRSFLSCSVISFAASRGGTSFVRREINPHPCQRAEGSWKLLRDLKDFSQKATVFSPPKWGGIFVKWSASKDELITRNSSSGISTFSKIF